MLWRLFDLMGCVTAALLLSTSAFAATPEALREAGDKARAAGEYAFAIQAYEQAYELTVADALLVTIARAYQQRFLRDGNDHDRVRALWYFRRYVALAPSGPFRRTADDAIVTLRGEDKALRPAERATRLSVVASVLGATAKIDDGPPRPLPLFVDIAPGKHRVRIEADGYLAQRREVLIAKDRLMAVSVVLDPEPAKLALYAPIGASIHIDGEWVGAAPLEAPLEVEPGRRHVAVTMNGFEPHAQTIDLERGKSRTQSVDLEITDQRAVAWALVSTGAAGIAAGIAFGVVAVIEDRRARDIANSVDDDDELDDAQLQEVRDARSRRDDFQVASGISAAIGLAIFVVGGALYILDEPDLPISARGGAVSFHF